MRIGFLDYALVDRTQPGKLGLSDIIWDLARGLVELGDEVHITGPFRTNHFPVDNVYTYSYHASDFWYRNIITQLRLIQIGATHLKQIQGLQIIHVPEYLSAAVLSYLVPNVPIILTSPGNIFERIARFNPYDQLTSMVYKWAARSSAVRCAQIIATSDDMAKWWQFSGAPKENISTIPLSVDTRLFHRMDGARKSLSWSDNKTQILFVGRLAAENRVEYLLHIMAYLVRLSSNVHLQLVGNGPLERHLKNLAEDLDISGYITWHGAVPFEQLPVYYSAADVYIFTRPTGAPPRVVPQAMACGLPVIAVRNAGLLNYLDEGSHGFYVVGDNPSDDAILIENKLRSTDILREWGVAAMDRAQNALSTQLITKNIRSNVYTKVLARQQTYDAFI